MIMIYISLYVTILKILTSKYENSFSQIFDQRYIEFIICKTFESIYFAQQTKNALIA